MSSSTRGQCGSRLRKEQAKLQGRLEALLDLVLEDHPAIEPLRVARQQGNLASAQGPDMARQIPWYGPIIQHPEGGPKQLSFFHNVVVHVGEGRVQYLTDTQPGSSGSPVFDRGWNVVALHHSGGWFSDPVSRHNQLRNQGIHVSVLVRGLRSAGVLPAG